MIKKVFRNMDYMLIIIVAILVGISLVALWSANNQGEEFQKQILWIGAGFFVMIVTAFIDYNIYRKLWIPLYIVTLVMLVAVLFTNPINGATSWFNLGFMLLQPSEIAKIVVVITLAAVISKMGEEQDDPVNKFKNLAIILIILLIPAVLIILQPDYGTAMTFFVFTVVMLFMSNLNKKYILIGLAVVLVALPLLYFFVLPQHAVDRINVYFNPNIDPLGKGYNILQSKLAVGSGMFLGMGIGKGNQTQLGYLYPKTTDFIFAVIAEEMGFLVAGLIIILMIVMLFRITYISKSSKDNFGALLSIGIMAMFLFYITENIGMTMGLLPITGVPLPFVSYGGSSMLSNMLAMGILLNISGQRDKIIMLG